jgi:hypothetical protein
MSTCNDTASGLVQKPEKFSYIEAKRADMQTLATCELTVGGTTFQPNCQVKIPSPDKLSTHGGNVPNGVSLGYDLLQVWIEVSGGAWQSIGLSSLPIIGTQSITPHTLIDAASADISQEFLDAMNAAIRADSEINQYFFNFSLPASPTSVNEACIASLPSLTNFVLVAKRNQDDGSTENFMYQMDTSANPSSTNPGSSFWYDGSETLPVGTPDQAGFWAGYTKYNATFDPTFLSCVPYY